MNSRYLQDVVRRDLNQAGGDPDHVYVDISIVNNGSNNPVHLKYNDTRDRAIIQDPSEYYMSVARFRIDTQSGLPLFIPQIQTGQNNVNLTVYSFSMTYSNVVVQTYLTFIPQDKTAPTPNAPTNAQDFSSGYYYLYNYGWFVDLINATLLTCFNSFTAALTTANIAGFTVPTNAPFFMYDPTSLELVINADKNYFNNTLGTPCFIYCNSSMKTLLSAFNYEINSFGGAPNGLDYKFQILNYDDTNTFEISETYTAIQMYESYNSISAWNAVQSIVLTTGSMPVVSTIQGVPLVFGSNTSLTNSSNNINVQIISDFEISLTKGTEILPSVNYAPPFYRLVPMTGNNPLHNIDISFYWKDIWNNLHPFMVSSNTHCDVKILFRKKYLGV